MRFWHGYFGVVVGLALVIAAVAAGDARTAEERPSLSRITADSVLARYPKPDDWHRLVLYGNWDFVDASAWEVIVMQADCDRATALAIFWTADPSYYVEFEDATAVPAANRSGYALISMIRKRWLAGKYMRAELAFDRALDARPIDLNDLRRRYGERVDETIPESMRVKLDGRRLDATGFHAPGLH